MTDQPNIPLEDNTPDEDSEAVVVKSATGENPPNSPPEDNSGEEAEDMQPRLERLGGEPAPDITPEEFARLQQSGQIHIDPRGRVRTTDENTSQDAGVSLRKRRAWYSCS